MVKIRSGSKPFIKVIHYLRTTLITFFDLLQMLNTESTNSIHTFKTTLTSNWSKWKCLCWNL